MHWKTKRKIELAVKAFMPPRLMNGILLALPFLYRTELVKFESDLYSGGGIDDMISQLRGSTGVEGEIIECGSSRCGSSIIMANHVLSEGIDKKVFACDTFEGFQPEELAREKKAGLASKTVAEDAFTSTSFEYVKRKIEKLGLADRVVPVKGYFQDTLGGLDFRYCFALMDCDLSESLSFCAETLWPRLNNGGRMVFDDYLSEDFRGTRLAVDRFVETHKNEIREHGLLSRLYYVWKR